MARLMAIVVLPTPPLVLPTARIMACVPIPYDCGVIYIRILLDCKPQPSWRQSQEHAGKLREMHPAYVMHMTGLHLGAVCRDDPAQLRKRQAGPCSVSRRATRSRPRRSQRLAGTNQLAFWYA